MYGQLAANDRVAVVGSGYVGTVVAGCLAHLGAHVTGLESDPHKLEMLKAGRPPFWEPGLAELLGEGIAAGRLKFTADPAEAMRSSDIVFLCVGTPSGSDGRPDMTYVEQAVQAIARASDGHHVIVTKSTVPIGSAQWLASILEDAGQEPRLVSNPEFLREGTAVSDYLHPDRIVIGSDDPEALEAVASLYSPIAEQAFPGGDPDCLPPVIRTGLLTAETVKYAANAFLATKISFINELANLCERVGADIAQVATSIGLDSRIGSRFLEPGMGWGGSCFGKDLSALIATAGDLEYEATLLKATVEVNRRQRGLVIEKLQRSLQVLRGRRIALLGLAFKPGTDDVRDSASLEVARRLVRLGALVTAYDPMVLEVEGLPSLVIASDPYLAAEKADAVVIATDWPEFVGLDLGALRRRMRGDLLVDGRNLFDPSAAEAAGLTYDCVGRSRASMRSRVAL